MASAARRAKRDACRRLAKHAPPRSPRAHDRTLHHVGRSRYPPGGSPTAAQRQRRCASFYNGTRRRSHFKGNVGTMIANPTVQPQPTGALIAIEGGDGTGKGTLISALIPGLREAGFDVLETREPGGTPEGQALRQLLLPAEASWESWQSFC